MPEKPKIIAFRPSHETWSILQARIDEVKKLGFRPNLTSIIQSLLSEADQARQKMAAEVANREAI